MTRRTALRALAIFAALAVGACSAVPTAHNDTEHELDREAARIANRLEESRLTLNEDGRPDSSAIGLARVAGGDDADDPPVLEAKGDVLHGGAEIVVRLETQTTGFAGANVSLTKCFRFRITEAFFHVDTSSTRCPTGPPLSLPTTTAPRPDLSTIVDAVKGNLDRLDARQHGDRASVRQAVGAAVAGTGATVSVSVRDGVVGVAVSRGIDCVLARTATDVEVWRPASVYPLYGRPGEISCGPVPAIEKSQQQPPH